jgi:hypothetical protein
MRSHCSLCTSTSVTSLDKGFVNTVPAATNTHSWTRRFLCAPCRIKYSMCSESVYGVPKVQMPLPGRCVVACTLTRNYGASNMGHIQEDQSLSSERISHFQTYK